MFLLNKSEIKQLRILIVITLVSGVGYTFFTPSKIHLKNVVMRGMNHLDISISDDQITIDSVEQKGKISPEKVIINNATVEQLSACPGISKNTAEAIVKERSFGKYYDWRDLQDRVKQIKASHIDKLKDAGVKLNPPDLTE